MIVEIKIKQTSSEVFYIAVFQKHNQTPQHSSFV